MEEGNMHVRTNKCMQIVSTNMTFNKNFRASSMMTVTGSPPAQMLSTSRNTVSSSRRDTMPTLESKRRVIHGSPRRAITLDQNDLISRAELKKRNATPTSRRRMTLNKSTWQKDEIEGLSNLDVDPIELLMFKEEVFLSGRRSLQNAQEVSNHETIRNNHAELIFPLRN